MIAGMTTQQANLQNVGTTPVGRGVTLCGGPIAQALNPNSWSSLFSPGGNDAIVGVTSQQYALSGPGVAGVIAGLIHTSGLSALGFSGPDELGPDNAPQACPGTSIQTILVCLLNGSIAAGGQFVPLP